MRLNKSDIEKLTESRESIEYWNSIFKNIIYNTNQILKNELSERYLKFPIEVEFCLNQNIKYDPNANVIKISDKRYSINIGRKLLISVNNYAYKIVEKSFIFTDLERNEDNKEVLSSIAQSIFYYWMEFIFLHEWSHIVRGHLEDENNTYYEFNILSEQTEEDLFFEVDADRFAMKLLIKKFASTINNLKTIINVDEAVLIENFINAMMYLFDLFFLLNGENRRGSHPSPLERINIVLPAIAESMHNQNTFNISEKELIKLLQKCVIFFTIKHGKEYKINPKMFAEDMKNLNKGYFLFINNSNIKKNQILRTKD